MNIKVCKKCKKELPETFEYFGVHKLGKNGFRSICKECRRIESALYLEKNREKANASSLSWYRKNAKEINKRNSEDLELLKSEYPNEYRKRLDIENKLNVDRYHKKGIAGRKKRKINRMKNIEKYREHGRKAAKKRVENPQYRCSASISSSIRRSLGGKGGSPWESLVGFTRQDIIWHLEKQFLDGMTWENYGEWHIDHKIPIAKFNYTKPEHEDFKRCWSLDNLQPLWAKDNQSKNAKINKPFQPSLLM